MTSKARLVLGLLVPLAAAASGAQAQPEDATLAILAQSTRIVAVVNGDVVSEGDVDNRARLFALSAGVGFSPELLARLRPQVTRQLIDERLRLQEAQRRHVLIADKQIDGAIHEVETRNSMPAGTLRHKLEQDGVAFRTLVDQVRVQLSWLQVLREQLGDAATTTQAEIAEQQQLLAQQTGKPEYRVAEIFIPIDNPANAQDAQHFAETVIQQLHTGAPFAVAAAQFSQSQTALEGGDLGWVQPTQLDPDVARIVQQMPVGAISNPIRVPGGLSIVNLRAKRDIGRDIGTILTLRQVFLPFSTQLDPQHPTDQQKQTLERAKALSGTLHSCEQMEAAAKANNSPRPPDPGEIRLEGVNPPAFREILTNLPANTTSKPLVAGEGIALIMVCNRTQKNMAAESKDEIERRLVSERAELASRQLLRDLQRKAQIDQRTSTSAVAASKS